MWGTTVTLDRCSIIANNVMLGGHVVVDDRANLGGGAGVHHFTTIGSGAFFAGLARVIKDVPPWMMVDGAPAEVVGCNPRGDAAGTNERRGHPGGLGVTRMLYREQVVIKSQRAVLWAGHLRQRDHPKHCGFHPRNAVRQERSRPREPAHP